MITEQTVACAPSHWKLLVRSCASARRTAMPSPSVLTVRLRAATRTPPRCAHDNAAEDNPLELHFTLKGPGESPYENGSDLHRYDLAHGRRTALDAAFLTAAGWYHGVLALTDKYPFEPPSVVFLTPNGRFETNTPICLNATQFHAVRSHHNTQPATPSSGPATRRSCGALPGVCEC